MGIRGATALDAERLADVHGQSWRESYRGLLSDDLVDSKEQRMKRIYASALAEPGAVSYWAATWDGEIVGLAAAEALGPGQERPLELMSLYVLADYQGRGIGSRLLNHAIGSAPCLLWVLDGSDAAGFYRSRGFDFDGVTATPDRLGGVLIRRMVR